MKHVLVLIFLVLGSVGCASQKFERIGQPMVIGDVVVVDTITERVNPWGTNSVTTTHWVGHRKATCRTSCPEQQQAETTDDEQVTLLPDKQCPGMPSMIRARVHRRPCPSRVQEPCCADEQEFELIDVQAVDSNHQGSIGWANGAFQGSVGAVAEGLGIAGAGALIRPSRTSVSATGGRGGGGGSASSSAISVAGSSAAASSD